MCPVFTCAMAYWRVFSCGPVSLCLFVCHKSVFCWNSWADWAVFWRGSFLRPIRDCVMRKFRYLQKRVKVLPSQHKSRYLNLDLKHICSPPSLLPNWPVRQRLWSHGNMALYKFCIVLYCIVLQLGIRSQTLDSENFAVACRLLQRVVSLTKDALLMINWRPLLVD